MKTIVIKTQKELDVLPGVFDEYTKIIIESKERIIINLCLGNSRVVVHGNATVEVHGNSRVEACGSSTVRAYGNATVEVHGNARVEAWDNSTVDAWDNSTVVAYGNARVEAWDNARVVACGSSTVRAYGNATVEVHGNARVVAWDNSRVVAWDNARVVACGSSTVRAYGNATVEVHGNARVEAYGNSTISLFISAYVLVLSSGVVIKKLLDYSTAVFKGYSQNVEEKSDTATVKKIPSNINVSFEEWLRRGYVSADGIIKKLISQKKIGDIEVFEVEEFIKNTSSYVVKRGETFSHGETIEKAIQDLRYKLSDRDPSDFEHWKLDLNKEVTLDEAIQAYRVITGACELGVKQFVESVSIPEKITPSIVLKLTNNQFGHQTLKKFLED